MLCVWLSLGLVWPELFTTTTSDSLTPTASLILVQYDAFMSQTYSLSQQKNNLKICILCASTVGYFFTGDGAYRSEEGYYQITGRLDDVINVSGHRIGTAEIEDVVVNSVYMSKSN